MHKNRLETSLATIFIFFSLSNLRGIEQDELVVVVVIDQFAHHAFQKVTHYLRGGMKTLVSKGIIFDNAHYPYAGTSTGPGHACLNTGVTPKDNGIVKNSWFDHANNKIACDSCPVEHAAVFKPDGSLYDFGKSAAQIKVDGISDQLVIASQPEAEHMTFSISIKPRAAVCTAGRMGKAFWFDEKTGHLTTSKAYFCAMPTWLSRFNKEQSISEQNNFEWKLRYAKDDPAYKFITTNHYNFCRVPSMIGKPLGIDKFSTMNNNEPYALFSKLPESNKFVLEAGKACLLNAQKNKPKKILLWLCLSSLDKVGHMYGPDSFEYIDTLYHIDAYLEEFMQWLATTFPSKKILYVLTADHGSSPIPELLQEQGFDLAKRIDQKELRASINAFIMKKHCIPDIIAHMDTPSLFLDKQKLSLLEPKLKRKVLSDIKHFLKKQPGFKDAWTFHELENAPVQKHDVKNYFKNSLFAGRSGEIQYQLEPYCFVTKHALGTGHSSPYDYTTHVPLVIYHKDFAQQKIIQKPVEMTQLAPTIAQFFCVSAPSACLYQPLPEVDQLIDSKQTS